jgi:hypothetical protein
MNGQPTLFVDQYGNIFWTRTIKDLRSKVKGTVSKTAHEPDDEFGLFIERFKAENPESAAGNFPKRYSVQNVQC